MSGPTELYQQQITSDGFLGTAVPEAYGGATGMPVTRCCCSWKALANNGIPLLNLVVCGPTMTMGLLAKHRERRT